jgi:hypothetical protein
MAEAVVIEKSAGKRKRLCSAPTAARGLCKSSKGSEGQRQHACASPGAGQTAGSGGVGYSSSVGLLEFPQVSSLGTRGGGQPLRKRRRPDLVTTTPANRRP